MARKPKSEEVTLTFRGETKTVAEWAEATGLTARSILARLRKGWSVTQVLATQCELFE
jgi:hypothetical protein